MDYQVEVPRDGGSAGAAAGAGVAARRLSELERVLLARIGRYSEQQVMLAARAALLGRRDAIYDGALAVPDGALRAAAVARAARVEEAIVMIEALLRSVTL